MPVELSTIENKKTKAMKRAIMKTGEMKTLRLRVPSSTNENKKLNEMKTKNNVQKTILRSLAVVISFVLVSFTVSAQDFWKKLIANSSFNEIALAMVETSKTSADSEATMNFDMSLLEYEVEPELTLEEWMSDESNFEVATFQLIEATESGLDLEEWMFDETVFQVEETSEQALELESWMISEKVWNI